MAVKSKVAASTLAAAGSTYLFSVLESQLGWHVSADLQALAVAALTTLAVFVAGFLKREHVIDDAQFNDFVGNDAPVAETAVKDVVAAEAPKASEVVGNVVDPNRFAEILASTPAPVDPLAPSA